MEESSIEKINHELESKDGDIAQMENVILEKEEDIALLKNTIDSIQPKESKEGETRGPDSPDIEPEKQDFQGWLPQYQDVNLSDFQSFILAEWNNYLRPSLDKSFQMILLKMSQVLREAELCIEMVKIVSDLCLNACYLLAPHMNCQSEVSIHFQAWKNWDMSTSSMNYMSDGNDFQIFVYLRCFEQKGSQVYSICRFREKPHPKDEWMPFLKNEGYTFKSNLKSYYDILSAETVEAYNASKNILLSNLVKLQRSATPFMQELIPVLKHHVLNFIYNLKPHFDFLSFETVEAYYASKKFLLSHIKKLVRSSTPLMQEMYNYAKCYMNQIATMAKIFFDSTLVMVGMIVKKIILLFHDLLNG
ncbi:hypothetical protein PIB30_022458 [Stylosanthes scabra]|uniref:Uncharacterized protein n=1 Tax=Stylosanthes scabra TaxID=79078 RepID=A0ABU6S9X0_9FABA|nr:hypothetical protein [Stylosanthes scabra]